jgi:hypothetical protein
VNFRRSGDVESKLIAGMERNYTLGLVQCIFVALLATMRAHLVIRSEWSLVMSKRVNK